MKTLVQVIRILSGRADQRDPLAGRRNRDKSDFRRRTQMAQALAKDYEALGWK